MKKHLKESLGLGRFKVSNASTGHATSETRAPAEDELSSAGAHADGYLVEGQIGLEHNGNSKKISGAHLDVHAERNEGATREPLVEKQTAKEKSPASVKPKARKSQTSKSSPAKKPRSSEEVEPSHGKEDSSIEIETRTLPKTYETLTPEYHPGDLLWSKIGRASFWPCMVIKCPKQKIYYQQKRDEMFYYVQYFGLRKHGWTQNSNRVLPFRGLGEYHELVKTKIGNVKYRKKFYDIDVPRTKSDQMNWDKALRKVEEAWIVQPSSLRYESLKLVFRYPEKKSQKKKSAAAAAQAKEGPQLPTENSSNSRRSSSPTASASPQSETSSDTHSQSLPMARTKASFRALIEASTPAAVGQADFNNNNIDVE